MDDAMRYLVPATVEEAVRLRREHGARARFIAGGTEVVPLMTQGRLKQTCLIELTRLSGLTAIAVHDRFLQIGAAVTLSAIEQSAAVQAEATALAEAAGSIREPQVRNRGTIGGNVAHGVPSADLVPALLALEAEVGLVGEGGRHFLALEDFLIGPYRTNLAADELLAEVRLPLAARKAGSAFVKLTKFGGSGLSVATAAAAVVLEGGLIARVRLAIGAAGPVPLRVAEAEAFLLGRAPDEDVLAQAGEIAAAAAEPREGSIRASAAHRRRVLKPLAARAVGRAAQRFRDREMGAVQ